MPPRDSRSKTSLLRGLATAIALLGWGILLLRVQRLYGGHAGAGSGWTAVLQRFSEYFTLLTNTLACAILTRAASARRGAPHRGPLADPALATSAAASMVLVAGVYRLLLSGRWNPEGWDRVADVGLHYVMPPLFLGYWWLSLPQGCLGWRDLPRTWIYPLLYLGWILARGASTGRYPYPFLDVGRLGAGVALNLAALFLVFNAVAAVLIWGNRRFGPPLNRTR